jgi:cytochrome c peroxidase
MVFRRRLALSCAVLAALTLAACGGSEPAPTSPSSSTSTSTSVSTSATPASVTQALTIDFVSVANYSFSALPIHYDSTVAQLDNAAGGISDRVATLGRVLFYDKKLSVNNTTSCSSCHQQALGFSDSARFSTGFAGAAVMSAHAPRLGNVRYFQPGTMFWDKRAASMEAQATLPITDPIEMGFTPANGGINAVITKMNGIDYYPELFNFAFGSPAITELRMQQALAQFQRAMVSAGSRWDTAYAQVYVPTGNRNLNVDLPGFNAEENRGRAIFMGVARDAVSCSTCHVPPTFALAADARGIGLDAGETTVFKAPSLKNVGLSGPFMHDGRFATLEDVLEHYNSGIRSGPALDPRLRDGSGTRSFNLDAGNKSAVAAFLRTLNDPGLTTDPRFSNPFRDR